MANTKNETTETMALATIASNDFSVCEVGTGAAIRATTTDSNKVLFNALNGQGTKIKDVLGVELDVVNIVVTSADVAEDYSDRENENAKKVSKPCAHFFTADGQHISSISNGICRAVSKLFEANMQPMGGEILKIMFTNVETKNGTAHSFILID